MASPALAEPSGPLVLAADGESSCQLVIGPDAPEPERFAAAELSRYLHEISGARLPVVTLEAAGTQVERLVLLGGAVPQAVREDLRGRCEDSFIIRTVGGNLLLAGASPRATLYAVYAFLETLGVGFPRPGHSYLLRFPDFGVAHLEAPGTQEETIPRQSSITVPVIDRLESPAFSYRALVLFPLHRDRALREIDWMAKNRLNWADVITNTDLDAWDREEVRQALLPELRKRGLLVQGIGHAFFFFIPPERYAAEHPEYFGVDQDGERLVHPRNGALCLSHPAVVELMADNMDRFLQENPEIRIIDLWTNDSGAWCYCPDCKRMQGLPDDFEGSYTTTTRSYLRFVNQVAERLAPRHPEVLITALAYAHNLLPDPETRAAPNVIVGLAPIGRYISSDDYYVPLREPGPVNDQVRPAILAWLERSDHFYLYDYYGNLATFFPLVDTMRKDLGYYREIGIDKVSSEVFYWPEFSMWAYARLTWDPHIPLGTLISDFCRMAYRSAAGPMIEFHTALERLKWEWPRYRPELGELITQAMAQAAPDPTVFSKLERLRTVLAVDRRKVFEHAEPPPPLEGIPDSEIPVLSARRTYLRPGDRVVFLGDSITQRAIWTGYIENWVRTFHPELRVQFFNAGKGSDNAPDGLRRLQEDVLVHRPSVVVMCYGMNDAVVRRPNAEVDPERLETYLSSHRTMIEQLREQSIRPFLLTPPCARPDLTGELEGHNLRLAVFTEELKKLAAEEDVPIVDVFHLLLEREEDYRRHTGQSLIPDGVHPGEQGNLLMAMEVLRAWEMRGE